MACDATGYEFYGEVFDKTPTEIVVGGAVFQLLLRSLRFAVGPVGSLPVAGGLLDQTPIFIEALEAFQKGPMLLADNQKNGMDVLKSLGA